MRLFIDRGKLSLPSLLLASLFGLPSVTHAHPFFQDYGRGWHWYEVLPVEEEDLGSPEDAPAGRQKPAALLSSQTPSGFIKAYREELERRLHTAWVHPTPQNIRAYQEMQQDLTNRSKTFAAVWMQNVYQHPQLDHTLVSPVNQQARHIQLDRKKEQTFEVIKSLSETFGLFFFFSGDCPYCHQFAPIVQRFAQTYGWEVVPIKIEGDQEEKLRAETTPGDPGKGDIESLFPNTQTDNGLSQAWGVTVLPALFAVNPHTQEAIPVAYGLTSLDEMETRVMALAGRRVSP